MMKKFAFLILLGVIAVETHAWELVVVTSNAERFQPGQLIDGTKPIDLETGRSLTLVSNNGEVFKLEGPFRGQPAPGTTNEGKDLLNAISSIVSKTEEVTVTAVFRSFSRQARDPWSIDVASTSKHCLHTQAVVTLWLQHPPGHWTTLNVTNRVNGGTVTIPWDKGLQQVPWPAEMELVDQGVYRFAFADSSVDRTDVTIRMIPEDFGTDAHRAAWMHAMDCGDQALKLLRNL